MVLVASHRISPVPWYSGTLLGQLSYVYRTITFYGAAFQAASTSTRGPVMQVLQPRCGRNHIGLGYSPFARRYSGNHAAIQDRLIVFSSSGYLDVSVPRVRFHVPMYSARDDRSSTGRVAPFGNPRIYTCLLLPVAYRSLPRPSSPVHAKASTIRP